jgi:hypothetical protein
MAEAITGAADAQVSALQDRPPKMADLSLLGEISGNNSSSLPTPVIAKENTSSKRSAVTTPVESASGLSGMEIEFLEDEDELSLIDIASSVNRSALIRAAPYAAKQTGLCYDPRMMLHKESAREDTGREFEEHPEKPLRIKAIYTELCNGGMAEDPEYLGISNKTELMRRIGVRKAKQAEVLLVHTERLYERIFQTQCKPKQRLYP